MTDRSNATPPAPVIPGQPAMWVFVMIEAITFSAYFVVYTINFRWHAAEFLQSQARLDLRFGVVNTLLLLTSSWSIARAVERARARDYGRASRFAWMTVGCGLLFAGLKLTEWSIEIGKGFTFSTDGFFSFYFFLTGIHLLHVMVGFIALGVVIYQLKSPMRRSQELIETGATYWHLVDLMWVIIFALIYVMR